jgi:CelD/BcsL family acetyltransferase involved in cellulose biosynthesis
VSLPLPTLTPSAPANPATDLSVRVLDRAADLEALVPAWEDLAARALEPNVFYEPWLFLPALHAFGAGRELRFVVVEDGSRLCGFFPLERRRLGRFLPLHVLGLWRHVHCFLGTPLVRADCAGRCLDAFFTWLADSRYGAALLELDEVAADGPLYQEVQAILERRRLPSFVRARWQRALLRVGAEDAETLLRATLSKRRRRILAQRQRLLGQRGQLAFVPLGPGDDVAAWADAFLACEASGWKGRACTAMACREAEGRFFRAATAAAFRRGRLLALALHLDGRPVALRCSFLAGGGAFAFKTAFDEQWADYSPGVLIEVETLRRLHDGREADWMDSCATGDNETFNTLWADRRAMATLVAATGRAPGGLVVSLLPALRALKRTLFRRPHPAPEPTRSRP